MKISIMTILLALLLTLTLAGCKVDGSIPNSEHRSNQTSAPENNTMSDEYIESQKPVPDSGDSKSDNDADVAFGDYSTDTIAIMSSPFAEHIAQGYVIEFAMRTIALIHPDLTWNEDDADYFTAKVDDNDRITIVTDGDNVFRSVEGMTLAEMHEFVSLILKAVGMD